MPFVLAGSALRVNLTTTNSLLCISEGVPLITVVAGGELTGVAAPFYGSRALVFGPPASDGDVIVSGSADIDYEVMSGLVTPHQPVQAVIGPDGSPTGVLLAGVMNIPLASGSLPDGDYGDVVIAGGAIAVKPDAIDTTKLGGDITADSKAFLLTTSAATKRTALALGTAATLNVDADALMTANAPDRLPAQSAVRAYVDNALSGLSWKDAVRAATTANGTLATAFDNASVIDGITLATGDRILVKNQTTGSENGLYTVQASGAPVRSSDADSGSELLAATVLVSLGTANAGTQWTCTTPATIVPGTTALTFAQIAVGGASYTADGATLQLVGNQFSVNALGVGSPQLAGAIPYSKLQNVSATDRLLGRSTAGAGVIEEIGCTADSRTFLASIDAANKRTLLGLGTAALAATGIGASTNLPTRADADSRFLRHFTAMPSGAVGLDGDVAVLTVEPNVLAGIQKVAGAWQFMTANSGTFAEMLLVTPTVAGSLWVVTTIDLGGGVGIRTVNALYRWNGTAWRNLYPVTLISTIADTALITNTQTAFQSCLSMTPPVGLFYAGCSVSGELLTTTVGATATTSQAEIHAAGAILVDSNNSAATFWRGIPLAYCRSDNILRAPGGARGQTTVSSAIANNVMPSAFNGSSVTFQLGATFDTATSDETFGYEYIRLVLNPG